jgi:hypothetical protein
MNIASVTTENLLMKASVVFQIVLNYFSTILCKYSSCVAKKVWKMVLGT